MTLVKKPEELVEAAANGIVSCRAAQVPFADQGGHVAGIDEQVGEGFFGGRQAGVGFLVSRADGVEFEPETGLVTPGQQARAGGGTEGGGDVALGESNPAGRERINVRRRNLGIALASEFTVAEVVREEDDDIGGRLGGDAVQGEQSDAEKEQGQLHGRARILGARL